MAEKAKYTIKLSESLSLSECRDGFWLYDYELGMNIAIRASSEREAFTQALTYYQNRLKRDNKRLKDLQDIVDEFVGKVYKTK